MVAAGDVQLVGAAAGLVAVRGGQELPAVRHDVRRVRRRAPGQPANAGLGVAPFDPVEEAAQRLGHVRAGHCRRPAGRPGADPGAGRVPGVRPWLRIRQLDRVRRQVDDARDAPARRARGLAGRSRCSVRHRLTAQHALQERGGFGEPPGAGEAGRLEHVGVRYVHFRCFLCLFGKTSGARGSRAASRSRCWRNLTMGGGIPAASAGRQPASLYLIRSARAALTAGLARRAPSTTTDSIVAQASSGVTSSAMLARPRTWIWSVWPRARTASRSSRL